MSPRLFWVPRVPQRDRVGRGRGGIDGQRRNRGIPANHRIERAGARSGQPGDGLIDRVGRIAELERRRARPTSERHGRAGGQAAAQHERASLNIRRAGIAARPREAQRSVADFRQIARAGDRPRNRQRGGHRRRIGRSRDGQSGRHNHRSADRMAARRDVDAWSADGICAAVVDCQRAGGSRGDRIGNQAVIELQMTDGLRAIERHVAVGGGAERVVERGGCSCRIRHAIRPIRAVGP